MLDSIICSPLPSCTSSVCPAAFKSRACQAHLFSANIQVQQPTSVFGRAEKTVYHQGCVFIHLGVRIWNAKKIRTKIRTRTIPVFFTPPSLFLMLSSSCHCWQQQGREHTMCTNRASSKSRLKNHTMHQIAGFHQNQNSIFTSSLMSSASSSSLPSWSSHRHHHYHLHHHLFFFFFALVFVIVILMIMIMIMVLRSSANTQKPPSPWPHQFSCDPDHHLSHHPCTTTPSLRQTIMQLILQVYLYISFFYIWCWLEPNVRKAYIIHPDAMLG